MFTFPIDTFDLMYSIFISNQWGCLKMIISFHYACKREQLLWKCLINISCSNLFKVSILFVLACQRRVIEKSVAVVVVVKLATSSWGVSKSWGGDVPISDRDLSRPIPRNYH